MFLAVDIGGTKVAVATAQTSLEGRITLSRVARYGSLEYPDLPALLSEYAKDIKFQGVAIGVAGPVLGRKVQLTNLPWVIDADQVQRSLGAPVALLNDLEAHGWAISTYESKDLVTLQKGINRPGHRALIAAGTGLGEAILLALGSGYRPSATEGGHGTFAPPTKEDLPLMAFLMERYQHVSWERVVSGLDGFPNLLDFLVSTGRIQLPTSVRRETWAPRDVGPHVTAAAERGEAWAKTVLTWFVRLYGAEAGNLALKSMAVGGVYLAGGIALKILPWLEDGPFLEGFTGKGRFQDMLRQIPVHVIKDELAALRGAAIFAHAGGLGG